MILTDSFGRHHNYLRISLTERCNMRCFYCMPPEGIPLRDKSIFMSGEEIVKLAEIFTSLGVNKIRLTGGEPLIRKCADQVIRGLGNLDAELAITTNGILVDNFIETFKAAGLKSVNLSLDSLKSHVQFNISRRNYFDRIVSNMKLLLDENFKVKVNVVVMNKVNDNEIIDFVELTKDRALHIRFIEFMPFNGNQWDWLKGVSYDRIMKDIREHYTESGILKLEEMPNETARAYKVKGYSGTFGIIGSVTHPFCASCNRLRITADGKLKNCLFSPNEIDLLTPLRKNENILPLIKESILGKKESRAGMNNLSDLFNSANISANRSMTAIGG